jgi:hypothetical protein
MRLSEADADPTDSDAKSGPHPRERATAAVETKAVR